MTGAQSEWVEWRRTIQYAFNDCEKDAAKQETDTKGKTKSAHMRRDGDGGWESADIEAPPTPQTPTSKPTNERYRPIQRVGPPPCRSRRRPSSNQDDPPVFLDRARETPQQRTAGTARRRTRARDSERVPESKPRDGSPRQGNSQRERKAIQGKATANAKERPSRKPRPCDSVVAAQ